MTDYRELIEILRECSKLGTRYGMAVIYMEKAADAIEELLMVAKKMHLWIFLHSGDEQAAYDECGLTDEMNAVLGYSGQFEAVIPKLPKEET